MQKGARETGLKGKFEGTRTISEFYCLWAQRAKTWAEGGRGRGRIDPGGFPGQGVRPQVGAPGLGTGPE